MKSKPGEPHLLLLNEKLNLAARKQMLAELCMSESPEAEKAVEKVLGSAAKSNGRDLYAEKKKELDEVIDALRNGPQRPGVYIDAVPATGKVPPRALVKLQDGTMVYPAVLDEKLGAELRRGDCVLVSSRAEAILGRDPIGVETGEEACLEDWTDRRVEVSVRSGDERFLCHVTEDLWERIEAGEIERSARLLVSTRQAMAFDLVPGSSDETAGFRYLSRDPVPDVLIDRDIADPPDFIEEVASFCHEEMTDPARRREYRLRRAKTYLLCGVSGSGKTLAIEASIRRIYEVMSEVTGVALDDLPPRVLRLKMSKLLSKWLGDSDKNADKLADEIAELAAMTIDGPGGDHEAPVILVLEEFDSVARARGGGEQDQIYDRIQTTLLQRLDHTSNATLRDRLVVIFATTNVQHLIDPAWLRRVGGETFHFGRLSRAGFAAVLDTHLARRPIVRDNGQGPDQLRRRLVNETVASLYGRGRDDGVVEITLSGTAAPLVKRRRDFLTGSVVDRAVQRASERACCEASRAEHAAERHGLSSDLVLDAIDAQVDGVVRQLTAHNAHEFVDLPSGSRVAHVRRLDPPAITPRTMHRNGAG